MTSFADYRVDGLILVSPRLEEPGLVAAASRIPTVVIGRELDSPELDTLAIDERSACAPWSPTWPGSATATSCT